MIPGKEVYKSFGVDPPPEAPRDPAKEKLLHAMLDDAASPEEGRQPPTKGRPLMEQWDLQPRYRTPLILTHKAMESL